MIDASVLLGAIAGAAVSTLAALILWSRRFERLETSRLASLQAQRVQFEQQRVLSSNAHVSEKAAALLDADRRHEQALWLERERLEKQLQASLHEAEGRHEQRTLDSLEALRNEFEEQRVQMKAAHNNDKAAALLVEREQLEKRYQVSLKEAERRHQRQIQKIESPLTVVVHPFVNTSVEKGFIRNSSVVEIGYKYQLMVQGMPCFPPHDVLVERQTKVEVDEQALAAWSAKAFELAQGATSIGGGGAARALISVAKTIVKSRL